MLAKSTEWGGGLSSLSKVVVLSTPGEAAHITSKPGFGFEDGVNWADDVHRSKGNGSEDSGWDVVYRFAQVGVTNQDVDWKSTCGNLIAAVAHVSSRIMLSIGGIELTRWGC